MTRSGRPPKLYRKATRKTPIRRRGSIVARRARLTEELQGAGRELAAVPEYLAERNLALAAALGWRADPAARGALVSQLQRRHRLVRSKRRKAAAARRVTKPKPATKRAWVRVKAHRRKWPG